jgi:DNA mismatch repair protein MutL
MTGGAGKKNRITALLKGIINQRILPRQGESVGRIRILEPQVAAQIAAGEVIVRPGAVVKELLENSLDAGARTITVELEEGGRRRLRVVDDGCGMSPAEARLSLERHATSKLRAETDLLSLTTLGFRGEALPSIAAVSRLELITCPPGASQGHRLLVTAGEVLESSPWPAAPGTQVTVEELFFNTPARRKFLKSKDAEQAYSLESVRHLALGYPAVHFLLRTAVKTLLQAPGRQSLTERVAALYGAELAGHLLPFALEHGSLTVHGLISEPDFSLASSRFQVFLVNRRLVQDRILGAVLKEAYQGLLPRGRHPAAVVLLQMAPEQVDVNVHPAKAEVRFQEPGKIYALLVSALRQGLGPLQGSGPRYAVSWQPEPPRAGEHALPLTAPGGAAAPGWAPEFAPGRTPTPGPAPLGEPAPVGTPWRFQDLELIGQLQATYILAQSPQGLVLIDQHAAHERVLYEALKSRTPEAAKQPLLFPRVLEVDPAQADWVRDHLEDLAQAGLELSPFGGAAFLLSAAPTALAQADLEAVLLETIDALAPLKSRVQPQMVREQALTNLACHGAIKAGERLSLEEIQALLRDLDHLEVSSHCPHGRPLWRLLPYGDIRQSFRRSRE